MSIKEVEFKSFQDQKCAVLKLSVREGPNTEQTRNIRPPKEGLCLPTAALQRVLRHINPPLNPRGR